MLSRCVHYSGGWGSSYRRQYVHVQIIINYMYLNSSVWARLTDERIARDIMRFAVRYYIYRNTQYSIAIESTGRLPGLSYPRGIDLRYRRLRNVRNHPNQKR